MPQPQVEDVPMLDDAVREELWEGMELGLGVSPSSEKVTENPWG